MSSIKTCELREMASGIFSTVEGAEVAENISATLKQAADEIDRLRGKQLHPSVNPRLFLALGKVMLRNSVDLEQVQSKDYQKQLTTVLSEEGMDLMHAETLVHNFLVRGLPIVVLPTFSLSAYRKGNSTISRPPGNALHAFPNGLKLVKLVSKEDFVKESAATGNGISPNGDPNRKSKFDFLTASLRDTDGKSLVTIELSRRKNVEADSLAGYMLRKAEGPSHSLCSEPIKQLLLSWLSLERMNFLPDAFLEEDLDEEEEEPSE